MPTPGVKKPAWEGIKGWGGMDDFTWTMEDFSLDRRKDEQAIFEILTNTQYPLPDNHYPTTNDQ
jgi:hypothetical protein